jgi:hypothetical protein
MTPVPAAERMKPYRLRKKLADTLALQQVKTMCPLKEIRMPVGIGVTNTDYGKKASSLNFSVEVLGNPWESQKRIIGSVTLGLQYGTDHKKVTHKGRFCCKRSEKYMEWLLIIRDTLSCRSLFPHDIGTLRVNAICGANTQWHTDTLRGTTDNCIYIFSDTSFEMSVERGGEFPGYLMVDKTIHFRACIVHFQGQTYIPLHYSKCSGSIHMIGVEPDPKKTGIYILTNTQKDHSWSSNAFTSLCQPQ